MQIISFLSIAFILLSTFSIQAQEQNQKHSVYFQTADYQLDQKAQQALIDLSVHLENYADYSIDIQAHTDDRGDRNYNDQLAQNRADAVQRFLIKQNIKVDRLSASAFGEKQPDFSNDYEEGRRQNRRVDIFVTTIKNVDYTNIRKQWQNDLIQKFTIDGNRPTLIYGKEGTKIWLKANTFVYPDGSSPNGFIEVRLTECYDFGTMLLADLTTISKDKLLQTGGMMKLTAHADGKELVVADNTDIQFAVPTKVFDPKMQLFYGIENTADARLEDWELTENPISNRLPRRSIPRKPNRPIAPKPLTYTVDETFKPQKPVPPPKKIFREVVFPDTTTVYATIKSSLFKNKKKVAAERRQKIDKLIQQYEKRLARKAYNEQAYLASVKKYEAAVAAYPQKIAEWEQEQKEKERRFYASAYCKNINAARQRRYQNELKYYEKALADHKRLKDKTVTDFETDYDLKGTITKEEMKYYFFQVNRAGWINCDKFYNDPDKELLILNEQKPTTNGDVYVVFKETNSIIRIKRDRIGNLKNQQFPNGEAITIIGWKVENGQPLLAKSEAIVGRNNAINLSYKKVRLQELKMALAGI